MTHYTVHLDCAGLPAPHRIAAEVRFAKALERALGGAEAVVTTCQAWTALSDSADEAIRPDDAALARRWQRAVDQARQAGLQELGEAEEAWFEVKLTELAASPE